MKERIAIALVYLLLGFFLSNACMHQNFKSERGFIGCVDGKMWAKNIYIANDTFTIPDGKFIIELNGDWCDK